jgi:hypothetical protein
METTFTIEIPSDIEPKHLQNLEEELNQVEGVEAELIKPKSVVAVTLLILAIIKVGMEAAKASIEVAKSLYDFVQELSSRKGNESTKAIVIVTKQGDRIEINDLSIKQIEGIIANR